MALEKTLKGFSRITALTGLAAALFGFYGCVDRYNNDDDDTSGYETSDDDTEVADDDTEVADDDTQEDEFVDCSNLQPTGLATRWIDYKRSSQLGAPGAPEDCGNGYGFDWLLENSSWNSTASPLYVVAKEEIVIQGGGSTIVFDPRKLDGQVLSEASLSDLVESGTARLLPGVGSIDGSTIDGGYVFAARSAGGLAAHRYDGGGKCWESEYGSANAPILDIAHGYVYTVGTNGRLYALNLATGEPAFEFNTLLLTGSAGNIAEANDDLLIAIGTDHHIYGLEKRTQGGKSLEVAWRMGFDVKGAPESWDSNARPFGQPVVRDNQVFIRFVDGFIRSLAIENGNYNWGVQPNVDREPTIMATTPWGLLVGYKGHEGSNNPNDDDIDVYGELVLLAYDGQNEPLWRKPVPELDFWRDDHDWHDWELYPAEVVVTAAWCAFVKSDYDNHTMGEPSLCALRLSATGVEQKWCYSNPHHAPAIGLGSLFISGEHFIGALE